MPKPKNNPKSGVDTANLRKNFIWNLIGSTASAFVSLFYMMIVTRLNGIDDAGIFSFTFSTAGMFLIIGVYSGRTFQVTDKNKGTTDSDYFYLKFATCAAMLITGLVFCLLRGYSGDKFMIIMFLTVFRAFEAFSESIYAVIQKHDRLYQVGRSFLMKALASLAGFWLIDFFTRSITLSCIAIIVFNVVVIALYDLPRLARTNFRLGKFDRSKVWYLFKIGFFTFGFTILNFYLINAARYALDSTASDSAQTIYGIIAMPATVLGLIGQYLIQPFLTSLKKLFTTDAAKFQALVGKLGLAILAVGACCVLAAWLLGIPVLELLYAIELDGNLLGLIFIIVGGVFNALILVLSTALVTMRRTSDQFWIYCVVAIAAFGLAHMLVSRSGVTGACCSYMLSMAILFVLYLVVFCFRMRSYKHNFTAEVKRASQE